MWYVNMKIVSKAETDMFTKCSSQKTKKETCSLGLMFWYQSLATVTFGKPMTAVSHLVCISVEEVQAGWSESNDAPYTITIMADTLLYPQILSHLCL